MAELVDTAFLGRLGGSAPLAALAVCNSVFAVAVWIFNFLVYVGGVHLARAFAQGDKEQVRTKITQTLSSAAGIGTAVALILWFFAPFVLEKVMGVRPGPRFDLTMQCYAPRTVSLPFVLMFTASLGLLRGLLKLKTALTSVAAGTAINIILTYVFLFHLELGVFGAALATTLSFVIALLGITYPILAMAVKEPLLVSFAGLGALWQKGSSFGADAKQQFLRTVVLSGTFLMGTAIASRMGQNYAAAHQVLLQFWLFPAFVLDGYAITSTSAGASIRERDQGLWRVMHRRMFLQVCLLGMMFVFAYLTFGKSLQAVFTVDPQILAILQIPWLAVSIMQIINAMGYFYDGQLFASGQFAAVRYWMWLAFFLAYLPLATAAQLVSDPQVGFYYLWLAPCGLNLIRFLAGRYEMQRQLKKTP